MPPWLYAQSTSAGAYNLSLSSLEVGLFLSRDCFVKYAVTKVLKRLESNKVRGNFNDRQKTLLLPVSCGVSSISLLHVLDTQLQTRLQRGRHASYTLHVLHIDQSLVLDTVPYQASLDLLKQRFPYACTTVRLEECFDYGISIEGNPDGHSCAPSSRALENGQRLKDAILSRASATSKADLTDIIRRRLIAAFARKSGCDSVLYGDSTTRLAERTLSETANGRGGFLPWLTSDKDLFDGVYCSYPLRDLLKKELNLYADTSFPTLRPLIVKVEHSCQPISSKDNTIDGLMRQYFASVEENHPSVVANVVRTSDKLKGLSMGDETTTCRICNYRIRVENWGGDQEGLDVAPTQPPDGTITLCYGCARTMQTS